MLSEEDVRDIYISSVLEQAGWNSRTQIRREIHLTKGRVMDEQKRIVVKVNELMKLCDQLAEEVEHSRALSGRLFDSIVYHLFEAH